MSHLQSVKLSRQALADLFAGLGGEAGLVIILERFYIKLRQDILLGFFFDGKNIEHIAEMQKKFLMRSWGVAKHYDGRLPAEAHRAMPPILSGHFDRRMVVLAETLRELQIADEHIAVWLEFESKFRSAVVAKP